MTGGHHYERHKLSSSLGTATVGSPETTHLPSPSNDVPPQRPPTHYSKPPSSTYPHHFKNDQEKIPYGINNQAHAGQMRSLPAADPITPSRIGEANVCISPGTVIVALVALGLILVISITATLWFALKRSEVKKYAESHHKSAFSAPTPAPYYRFSHW